MQRITYPNIENDKDQLIQFINESRKIYAMKGMHMQVLECDQWFAMLNRKPIKTEYTSEALIALKNILNDTINYIVSVENRFEEGEIAMKLFNKVINLFNK